MVVKAATMRACDTTCRWRSGAVFGSYARVFRFRRRNWLRVRIFTETTLGASNGVSETSGSPPSISSPELWESRWRISSLRFATERGASTCRTALVYQDATCAAPIRE